MATRFPRRAAAALCTAALALPAVAADKPVYKYRLPDGGVLYSDQLDRSTGRLEQVLTAAPAPAPQQVEAARRAVERELASSERPKDQRADSVDAASHDVGAARRALADAQAALQRGLEPLPGERRGNVDGRSRLTEAYWARVARLRDDVERARQRLDDATARLQALR